jgi:hypothetical protein
VSPWGCSVADGRAPYSSQAAEPLCDLAKQGNYFDGRYYGPGGPVNPGLYAIRGAEADIRFRGSALCELADNSSVTWTMLQPCSYCPQVSWAQIGYLHKNYGNVAERYFWQWKSPSGVPFTGLWGAPQRGQLDTFTATIYPSDGKIRLLLNGALPPPNGNGVSAVTSFKPVEVWSGIGATWSGEVLYPESDIMGTQSYQTDIDLLKTKNTSDSWIHRDPAQSNMLLVKDFCWMRSNLTGPFSFEIHTHPVDHAC